MFTNFTKIWEVILRRGGYWAIEWPDGNAYWNNPLVLDFLAKVGSPIYEAKALAVPTAFELFMVKRLANRCGELG